MKKLKANLFTFICSIIGIVLLITLFSCYISYVEAPNAGVASWFQPLFPYMLIVLATLLCLDVMVCVFINIVIKRLNGEDSEEEQNKSKKTD